ncbi:M14 family metallopeptidase [Chitinimonas lacunae]|uniref:M14-type cytosolic carboxypeptidase n=1 Tax=Chitinimonas lacunae TaxID=1963018 RepID=A0ABV8MM82_9NEIS
MTRLTLSTAFDAGSIELVSLEDHRDIQLRLRPDNASEFAQWFHFRLQGAAGLPLTMRFLNAGQSAYPEGWVDYRAVASYDRQHWFRVPTSYDGQVMTIQFTPMAQSVYFAYFEPYHYERHLDLIGFATESDLVEVEHLGLTLDGRDMTLLKITDPEAELPIEQRRKVWLIARQHPGETMAEWFVEGFLERLLDGDDSLSRSLLGRCVFYVVPHMNPDGAVRGNLRTNAAGANLNREWQNPSAERSPEVLWVRNKMEEVGVDLFLDAHGDESIPYNFVAGCEGNPGYTDRLYALEEAFKAAWLATTPDFQTEQGYERDEAGQANMTLATNWVGQRFDCLAYTIEMPFKDNAAFPDLEYGWNGERSRKLGASVLQPIYAMLPRLR